MDARHLTWVIIFSITSWAKCSHALPTSKPSRACVDIVQDLRKIAWDNPDAFDVGQIDKIGTIKYMCYPDADTFYGYHVEGKATKLDNLCIEAIKLRCRP